MDLPYWSGTTWCCMCPRNLSQCLPCGGSVLAKDPSRSVADGGAMNPVSLACKSTAPMPAAGTDVPQPAEGHRQAASQQVTAPGSHTTHVPPQLQQRVESGPQRGTAEPAAALPTASANATSSELDAPPDPRFVEVVRLCRRVFKARND
jgi:hypothetical protein